MALTALKFLLFIASMTGYVEYLYQKFKIQVEFLPVISISLITVILFLAGLLNILPLISILLFLIGLYLLLREVINALRHNDLIKKYSKYITPGIIVFAIANLYFIFLLKDQRLIHYDNFSHWGLVVKNILIDNSLPNFQDEIIGFSSYPVGSALFIYYFCRIVGISEGLALIGQMIYILSGLLTLFSFSSFKILEPNKLDLKIKYVLNIINILASVYLLNGPSPINSLLVDTLLNIIGISVFALIFSYLDSPYKILYPLAFMVTVLTLIKNSGLFFAIFNLIFYLIAIIKKVKKNDTNLIKRNKIYKFFIPMGAPFITNYLWAKHTSMVFPIERLSKHTMSIESYVQTFSAKTGEEITEITNAFISKFNGRNTIEVMRLIFIFTILLILFYIFDKKFKKILLGFIFTIFTAYIFYNLGLWAMFLVSMPTGEALYLAGYGRYISTIVDYLFGVSIIGIVYVIGNNSTLLSSILSSAVVMLYFVFLIFSNQNLENTKAVFQRRNVEIGIHEPTLANIDLSIPSLSLNPMKSQVSNDYLVYYPTERSIDYESYYLKYRLYQPKVNIIRYLENLDVILQYDLLTITVINDEVINLFEKYSEEVPVIGTYKIDKENERILNKLE